MFYNQRLINTRSWEILDNVVHHSKNRKFMFKVMSYNVLSQMLLERHPFLYKNCYLKNLHWNSRFNRIYSEITRSNPDILCLQEVQASHIQTFYKKFEELGYFGVYKQKTGDNPDGCAIYFKKSLFRLEGNLSVEFYRPNMRVLNRDNVGLLLKLVPHHLPNSPFVVATTHLLFNPKRTDVRLAQMQIILSELDKFAYVKGNGHMPIILTGDFNSHPSSDVIKLLDGESVVSSNLKDVNITDNCQYFTEYINRQGFSTSTKSDNVNVSNSQQKRTDEDVNDNKLHRSQFVSHSLKLSSVYDRIKPNGQLEATTCAKYWITVDYIYFSYNSTLKLVQRLQLPTDEECEMIGAIPNHIFGSDHFALGAVFELK